MAALITNSNSEYLYVALENDSGFPVIARSDDIETWSSVYEPGAGTAANVLPFPNNPKYVLFYGNFGTDVGLIIHNTETLANDDITPSGLGSNVINSVAINPYDNNQIIVTINGDEDVLFTDDGGQNWQTLNNSLGFDATALEVLWSISGWSLNRMLVAGNPSTQKLLYSPNNFSTNQDIIGSLSTVANICSIEVII